VVLASFEQFDPRELLDFCCDRMPYFSVPRYIRVIGEVPRNALGRVRKDLLRADGAGQHSWDGEAHGYILRR
jgi:carnitine-CoA ligase